MHEGWMQLDGGRRMPGAGLSRRSPRKAPLGQSAFRPYWGKLAVRNDRGDRGNVGIIRSPIRASILPDPSATSAAPNHNALDAGLAFIKILVVAAKMPSPEIGVGNEPKVAHMNFNLMVSMDREL
jgi:hypothetical protein